MQIALTPQRRDDTLTLSAQGDVLTFNGVAYDFGPLPDGGVLPRAAVACDWLASDVTREGGTLRLTLILPHGPDSHATAAEKVALVIRWQDKTNPHLPSPDGSSLRPWYCSGLPQFVGSIPYLSVQGEQRYRGSWRSGVPSMS